MKTILKLILLCWSVPCLAQPLGHHKIFLEITDGVDTIDFKSCFKKNEMYRRMSLKFRNYQLIDINSIQRDFNHYPGTE